MYKSFWKRRLDLIKSGGVRGLIEFFDYVWFWRRKLFGITLAIPAVIALRLMRPFKLVRFGNLNSGSLGHWSMDAELYLCEKELGLHPPGVLDLFFFGREPCNAQFKLMNERAFAVSSWYKYLWMCNQVLPGGSQNTIKMWTNLNSSYDNQGLLESTDGHFDFTKEEDRTGEAYLRKIGLKPDDKFVCLIVRDHKYLNDLREDINDYHDFRNSDIADFKDAVLELNKRDYWVFRMGKNVATEFDPGDSKTIDYANTPERSDFLDIWLMAHCHFCVSTATGLDSIAEIFRRPVCYVNALPLGMMRTVSHPESTWQPKTLVDGRSHEKIGVMGQIKNGSISFLDAAAYESAAINIQDNTPDEISSSVLEMCMKLEERWVDEEQDDKLHEKFNTLFRNWADYHHWHGPTASKMPTHFLRRNADWFLS